MNPNLKTDYEKDKKKFELKMQKLEKQLEKKKEVRNSIFDEEEELGGDKPWLNEDGSIKDRKMFLYMSNWGRVVKSVEKVKTRVLDKSKQIQDLKELNKYYYKMDESSKVESNRLKECTPEMVHKFIKKIKKEEETDERAKKLKEQKEKTAKDNEAMAQRMKKVKMHKNIYSIAATYHEEMGILALALIDRELRIYKLKQNGHKFHFHQLYSFKTKDTVAQMDLQRYATNQRAMLFLGSHKGDVSIYYLDEPVDKNEVIMPGMFIAGQELH